MRHSEQNTEQANYVETPAGIFTAGGLWFYTTEDALQAYARPVLERVSLERLLGDAEVWLRSPETITLWALPLFLLVIPPLPAALAALTLYAGWKSLSPAFVTVVGVRLFKVLEHVLVEAAVYVLVLSLLAAQDQFAAVGVGLGGFILLRWGLAARLVGPLVRRLWATLYRVPVPDQVLRALIVRFALKHRLSLPELDRMEQQIMDNWTRNT